MPTYGKAAASTALPQPPSTSQNVPIASAVYFLAFMPVFPPAAVSGPGCASAGCHCDLVADMNRA